MTSTVVHHLEYLVAEVSYAEKHKQSADTPGDVMGQSNEIIDVFGCYSSSGKKVGGAQVERHQASS
jgi:hypothetical protein